MASGRSRNRTMNPPPSLGVICAGYANCSIVASLLYSKVLGVEFQLLDHGAEGSGRDLAREVLDSGNAVGTDIQRAMASPTVLGNPVVAELLRSCNFPRFSQELGTLRESMIVHLCTKVKNLS